MDDPLQRRDIALIRADNPGPFTLDGTNTWLVGRDPCWIVDPGPALDAHVDAVLAEARRRGGVGGIALTHDHGDHAGAAEAVRAGAGEVTGGVQRVARACDADGWPPVGAARWEAADLTLADGDLFGPLRVVATPGHATDHLAFVFEDACFTGDAVLAESSVFVAPDPGALRGYLAALERLRDLDLALLCTGHGPPVSDPRGAARSLPRAPPRARAAPRRGARRGPARHRRAARSRLGRRAGRACASPRRQPSPRTSTSSKRTACCPTACSARRGRRPAGCDRSSEGVCRLRRA